MTPFFLWVLEERAWNDPWDRLMVLGKRFNGMEVAPSLLKFHLLHKNLPGYPTEDAFPVLWIPKTLRIYCIFWCLAYIPKYIFLVAVGLELGLPHGGSSPYVQGWWFRALRATENPDTGHRDLVNTGSLDLREIDLRPISFYLKKMKPFLMSTES